MNGIRRHERPLQQIAHQAGRPLDRLWTGELNLDAQAAPLGGLGGVVVAVVVVVGRGV